MTAPSLIERLEGAERGSRELDREIMALFYHWDQRPIGATCWDDEHDTCCPGGKHLDWVWSDPLTDCFVTNAKDGFEFTISMDRALALAERVLPGCRWEGGVNGHEGAWAQVFPDLTGIQGRAPTPALALCIAILHARKDTP